MKKPTLASLAAELRVSRQTISNVINFPDRVRAETRARVQAAIDNSGYRPSAAARALRNQRAMAVGIRLSPPRNGISGAFMDDFLRALVTVADERGYRVVVFPADSRDEEVERLVELRATLAIDGGILTDTWTGDDRPACLAEAGVAFVAFGRPWGAEDHGQWVDVDGRAGAEEAVRFLQARGHERIGFIGWSDGSPVGADRRAGWQAAMALGDDDARRLTVEGEDSVDAGGAGMAELLTRGATAAVCASDALALGAFLANQGVTRTHVVGFDDSPVARAIGIPSLRQPVDELARLVFEKALVQMTGVDEEAGGVLVKPVLEARGN